MVLSPTGRWFVVADGASVSAWSVRLLQGRLSTRVFYIIHRPDAIYYWLLSRLDKRIAFLLTIAAIRASGNTLYMEMSRREGACG